MFKDTMIIFHQEFFIVPFSLKLSINCSLIEDPVTINQLVSTSFINKTRFVLLHDFIHLPSHAIGFILTTHPTPGFESIQLSETSSLSGVVGSTTSQQHLSLQNLYVGPKEAFYQCSINKSQNFKLSEEGIINYSKNFKFLNECAHNALVQPNGSYNFTDKIQLRSFSKY